MSTMACLSPRLQLTQLVLYLNFLLWLLPSQFEFQTTAQLLPETEVKALVGIIKSLKSPPVAANNITETYCQHPIDSGSYVTGSRVTDNRFAIKCSNSSGNDNSHIIKLVVRDMNFNEELIPEELGDLTLLQEIDLSENKLHGTIPDALWRLNNLTHLDLSLNRLTGSIPDTIGNLRYLQYLDLSNNQLTGPIPESIGNTGSLEYLYLDYNLLNDSIPQSLGSLGKLKELGLMQNRLSGTIPKFFGELVQLTDLYLGENNLDGQLPDELGNLTSLESLDVEANSLTGEVPKSYGQLTNLRYFWISGNNITGPLPVDVITKWPNITRLSLLGNDFRGNLTPDLFKLPSLVSLQISDLANASFQFPSTANTNFITLVLRNCGISGSIPKNISAMSSLRILDLSLNTLTGGIPENMESNDLVYVSFASNMLSGKIPTWILHAVRTQTDLSFNYFSGIISPVPSAEKLNLFACCRNSSTSEQDMADEQLWRDPFKRIICPAKKRDYNHSLYINCGGGEITVKEILFEQDNATSLYSISQKGNWAYSSSGGVLGPSVNSSDYTRRKCGISSDEPYYDDARLSPVSLRYYAFCLREGKYNVILRFAEIVFTEDADYSSLVERTFNVDSQGKRVIDDFNIKEMAGGPHKQYAINFTAFVNKTDSLLEIHLYWTGKDPYVEGQGPLISAISVLADFKLDDGENKLDPLYVALIAIASTIFVLLLLVAFAWRIGWLGRKKLREIKIGQHISVPLKELIAATGKFSDKKKIGTGDFGIVYEAQLQGQTVAVKKLSSHFNKERIKELKNEIFTIGSLEYNNLLKLWDVHIEKGLQLLVYEYMENKSLADALFGSNSRILKLTWETRFNICLGIARGLEYLHEHPRLKIVHMNIKAANILLDGKLEAKLSDFGLASVYTEENEVMVIKNKVSQGYMAPEYVQGNITSKTDVYSFGVVILEIVSGKKNVVSKSNQESEVLLDMAYKAHEHGKLLDLVDQNLGDEYDTKQVLTILNLALKCTSVAPSVRPKMSAVVSVLLGKRGINEILQAASSNGGEKTKASGDHAKAVSNTSMELASIASTSSPSIKGTDELENM